MRRSKSEEVVIDGTKLTKHSPSDIIRPVTRSTRSLTLTERGHGYKMDILAKKHKRAKKQLDSMTRQIENKMLERATRSERELLFSHWMTLYDGFVTTYEEYNEFLEEGDHENDRVTNFQPANTPYIRFKGDIEEWIQLSHDESNSTVSRSSKRSSKSRTSHTKSSHGTSFSLLSAKMREQQRQAELETRSSTLKRKQQLQQSQLKLKQEEEELEISTELAVSRARSNAIKRLEDEIDEITARVNPSHNGNSPDKPQIETRSVNLDQVRSSKHQSGLKSQQEKDQAYIRHQSGYASKDSSDIVEKPTKVTLKAGDDFQVHEMLQKSPPMLSRSLDPYAPAFQPQSQRMVYTSDAILSIAHHLKMPLADLEKFDGDPLRYKQFMRQFQTKIVQHSDNDDERFQFLEQYTSGEPHRIVQSLSYLDSDKAYPAALCEFEKRYGDKEVLASSFVKRALKWPHIKPNDSKALDEFSIFLNECNHAMECMSYVRILENPDNIRKLIGKLPMYMHDKWRTYIQRSKDWFATVRFVDIVQFVQNESRKANHPIFGKAAMLEDFPSHRKTSNDKSRSHFAEAHNKQAGSVTNQTDKHCVYCGSKQHLLETCSELITKPFHDRIQFLKSKGLCYGCLKLGHSRDKCRNKKICANCSLRHPTVLHISKNKASNDTSERNQKSETITGQMVQNSFDSVQETTPKFQSHVGRSSCSTTFAIVPVRVSMKGKLKDIVTYAFLDPGSNVSFASEGLLQRLGGIGYNHKKVSITLDTMGKSQNLTVFEVNGLQLHDLDRQYMMEVPRVFSKDKIPASVEQIPTEEDLIQWPHLHGINLPHVDATVELLIGNHVPDAYTPLYIKSGPSGTPHAAKTRLGWVIWNLIRTTTVDKCIANRAQLKTISSDANLDKWLEKQFNYDFPESQADEKFEMSMEDKKFMSIVDNTMRLEKGHYIMDLPFKDSDVHFPDNISVARKRLNGLKQRFIRDKLKLYD